MALRSRDCRRLVEQWKQEGRFDALLPEVVVLRNVPQPERYHAEGDAFTHTMLALDAVDGDADPRVFWGVLLHDIGKAATTELVHGHWRSYGHAKAGAALVPAVMERIGYPELASDIAWLVREHLFHFFWELSQDGRLTKQQRRFMEHPLFSLLLQVCLADSRGSLGSDQERRIRLIYEIYSEDIVGNKGNLG